MFVLISTKGLYYTGRAGEGWVSSKAEEAFVMGFGEANRKANLFNDRTHLTGVTFLIRAIV